MKSDEKRIRDNDRGFFIESQSQFRHAPLATLRLPKLRLRYVSVGWISVFFEKKLQFRNICAEFRFKCVFGVEFKLWNFLSVECVC